MNYKFFGNQNRDVFPICKEFSSIKNQRDLYDKLCTIWCRESCAPRYREKWSESNKTLGQCSITSFLVQDIFGGEVYGIKLKEGGFHCYNVVDGVQFDLTSEQFNETLEYENLNPQSREEHFADNEKYQRYLYLKRELKNKL